MRYEYNNSSKGGGAAIGFLDLLLLANIILKLCHVIDWSWWIVLWPLWVGIAVFIFIVILVIIVARGY